MDTGARKTKFRIEGTNLVTDKSGYERIQECRKKYEGRELTSPVQQEMTAEVRGLLSVLKEEGRLVHKDGYKV